MKLIASTLLGFALVLTSCSAKKDKDKPKPADKSEHDDHGDGPHGGTVFDFCDDTLHLELTVDHKKQEARIYVLDVKTTKKPTPIQCDKLTLRIKDPPFEVELKPDRQKDDPEGKCSQFAGKHEKLGKEQEFAGTVKGKVAGKECSEEFAEKPEKK